MRYRLLQKALITSALIVAGLSNSFLASTADIVLHDSSFATSVNAEPGSDYLIWPNNNAYQDLVPQSNRDKAIAVAQLNQCIESLSRIIQSQSRLVLINEQESLINCLDTEHADQTVIAFRQELNDALNALIINEEDKLRVQKMAEEELNNAVLQSLSDALGQPWVATNTLSAVISTAKTAAQSVVNYNLTINKIKKAEDRNLWQIEKESLRTLGDLRTKVISFSKEIMEKYNLDESLKIVPEEANLLAEALAKDDPTLRLNDLKILKSQKSYKESIAQYAPYWYFLGDTYMKLGKQTEGFEAYEHYLEMDHAAPIFRKNVYKGLIYLDFITYRKNIPAENKTTMLKEIEYHLSDNGPAMIIVAANYYALGNVKKATELLASCLGSSNITCKDDIVRTLANYATKYKSNKELASLVTKSINTATGLKLSTVLDFVTATKNDSAFEDLKGISDIKVSASNHLKTIDEVVVIFPSLINASTDIIRVYSENRESIFSGRESGSKYYVYESSFKGQNWIKKSDITKFEHFKNNENDIEYLFRRVNNNWYVFREELDLSGVKNGEGLPKAIYDGLTKYDKNGRPVFDEFEKLEELWKKHKTEDLRRKFVASMDEQIKDYPYKCIMQGNSSSDYEISIVVNEASTAPTYILKYSGTWASLYGENECTLIDIFKY